MDQKAQQRLRELIKEVALLVGLPEEEVMSWVGDETLPLIAAMIEQNEASARDHARRSLAMSRLGELMHRSGLPQGMTGDQGRDGGYFSTEQVELAFTITTTDLDAYIDRDAAGVHVGRVPEYIGTEWNKEHEPMAFKPTDACTAAEIRRHVDHVQARLKMWHVDTVALERYRVQRSGTSAADEDAPPRG